MSKDLIQQLKDNEKPFVLMSEEMQERAKEIGPVGNFLFLTPCLARPEWALLAPEQDVFQPHITYRLRPDYEEEPEIVEYKIMIGGCTAWMDMLAYIDGKCVENGICEAPSYPDFIGFKFEDGHIANSPVLYSSPGTNLYTFVHIDPLKKNHFKVLHATHVLFRRPK